MDDAQQILLGSLESSGVALPFGVSSARGLSPDALFSICAQSLRLVDPSSPPLPLSLPAFTADRFKVCADVAAAVGSLGYRGELTFRQLLYPSYDDSYKLLRFLVEKLSSGGSRSSGKRLIGDIFKGGEGSSHNVKSTLKQEMYTAEHGGEDSEAAMFRTRYLRMKKELPVSSDAVSLGVHGDTSTVPEQANKSGNTVQLRNGQECRSCGKEEEELSRESEMDRTGPSLDSDTMCQRVDEYYAKCVEKLASLHEQTSKMNGIVEDQQSQERLLMENLHAKASEVQELECKLEILKIVTEMGFYDHHHTELYIEEINKRIEARRSNLLDLESQWNAFEKSFEERRLLLEQLLYADKPEQLKKVQQLKEIKLEMDAIFSEIHKRDEEYSKLAVDLEKQPKVPTRKSYIERITEITKNSRKQDADIQRIIDNTRELQIESNSISERLHRIYTVVDETVFREAKSDSAKRDPARKNVYRLLTSIHGSFEQIADKILLTDRARRESADLEAKLAGLASSSVDIDKLQADLDAIMKENEFLEQQLQHD